MDEQRYDSYNYNQDSYGQNNYNPDNSQGGRNNKKNNKWKQILAIVGGIVAVIAMIAVISSVFIGSLKTFAQKGGFGKDSDYTAENIENDEDAETSSEAVATTKPVSTVQAGNISGSPVDVSDIVEEAMPCVVSITSTTSVEGYSIFGQQYQQEVPTCGTGFIVGQNDKELLLATNNHVVEDATAIQVTFVNNETAEAVVKGTDAQADLAVVAVSLEDINEDTLDAIKVAVLGDSDNVKVGQMAVAIGNAQGMGQSVTAGYISAKDRQLSVPDSTGTSGKTMTFLQTDAAINGGNSGGPLLNADGEVVGINSAKISDTQVEGMCFAIPISQANPIINDLMNRETLTDEERGYMGVSLQNIAAEAVKMYGVPDGVYVASVSDDGPADKAGLEEGDIITEINGAAVNSSSAAVDKVNSYRAGTEIKVVYYRRQEAGNGYAQAETTITLATAEELGINTQNNNNKASGNDNNDNNSQDDYYEDDDLEDYLDRFFRR